MRKLVRQTLIMLPLLFLSLWSGVLPVASAFAAQETVLGHAPLPLFPPAFLSWTTPAPAICDNKNQKEAMLAPLTPKNPVIQPIPASVIREIASVQITPMPAADVHDNIPAVPPVTVTPLPLGSVVTPTPSAGASGGLNAAVIFALVNEERARAGLQAFSEHPVVCAIAQSRAPELENEIFGTSYMHAGFQARHLPFHATENMISQQTEQAAVAWWMNSSVHRAAILGNTQYACVACQGKSCAMIFADL